MTNIEIIRFAGIILLILGGVSGLALFIRAISGTDQEKKYPPSQHCGTSLLLERLAVLLSLLSHAKIME